MKVYYRISSSSYIKNKLPFTDKLYCLDNFLKAFPKEEIYVIADNCDQSLVAEIKSRNLNVEETALGNSGSFLHALKKACNLESNEIVYFVEDDYIHAENAREILEEGFNLKCDYVTIYDHPDKYGPMYSNGELCKVFKLKHHWRYTISTCMTFASKVNTLIADKEMFVNLTTGYSHPQDHTIFSSLKMTKMRNLVVCMPGAACHIDMTYSEAISKCCIDDWVLDMILPDAIEKAQDKVPKEVLDLIIEKEEKFEKLCYLEAAVKYPRMKCEAPAH